MPKIIFVNFEIPIREDDYKLLKELGYDFEKNISQYLIDTVFHILVEEAEKEVQ